MSDALISPTAAADGSRRRRVAGDVSEKNKNRFRRRLGTDPERVRHTAYGRNGRVRLRSSDAQLRHTRHGVERPYRRRHPPMRHARYAGGVRHALFGHHASMPALRRRRTPCIGVQHNQHGRNVVPRGLPCRISSDCGRRGVRRPDIRGLDPLVRRRPRTGRRRRSGRDFAVGHRPAAACAFSRIHAAHTPADRFGRRHCNGLGALRRKAIRDAGIFVRPSARQHRRRARCPRSRSPYDRRRRFVGGIVRPRRLGVVDREYRRIGADRRRPRA